MASLGGIGTRILGNRRLARIGVLGRQRKGNLASSVGLLGESSLGSLGAAELGCLGRARLGAGRKAR